ncbi:MAG: hypothetical protein ACLSGA_15390 [Ruminococcus sp.]
MPFTIDDLNYDKDSKERMPWEHYLELYAKADPKEIASDFPFHMMKRLRNLL